MDRLQGEQFIISFHRVFLEARRGMYAGSVQFDRVSNENHYRFISAHWEWYTAITDFEQAHPQTLCYCLMDSLSMLYQQLHVIYRCYWVGTGGDARRGKSSDHKFAVWLRPNTQPAVDSMYQTGRHGGN